MAVDRRAIAAAARGTGQARGFGGVVRFFREVGSELTTVAWPSRHDIVKLTMVVLVAIGIFAVYIFSLDIVVGYLTKPLFAIAPPK